MTLRRKVISIIATAFMALAYLFAWSPVFTVKGVNVTGIPTGVNADLLIRKTGVTTGEKIARIEPRSIEKMLSEISWIKRVSISRNWINGRVEIAITSRIPVGIYQGKAVDASGNLFELPGELPAGLPVVSAATPELGLTAITLFTALPLDLRSSLISMSAASESAVTTWQQLGSRNIKVSWGAPKQIALKVSVYRALLALPENKSIKRIDLSAPHAPIVK